MNSKLSLQDSLYSVAIHLWRPHGGVRASGSGGRMWTGERGPAPCVSTIRTWNQGTYDVFYT